MVKMKIKGNKFEVKFIYVFYISQNATQNSKVIFSSLNNPCDKKIVKTVTAGYQVN